MPLVFDQSIWAHVTPLLFELHWLLVAAHIQLKALTLVFKVITRHVLSYLP